MSSSAIAEYTGFGKNKVITILKNLVDKGYVSFSGQGRGIRYTRQ
jgi:ATP-dependent DNA helicase RecG